MKRYWKDLEIGSKLLELESHPITRVHIAKFVSATNNFSPLYLDDEFAKNAGFSSAFAPNLISLSLLENVLEQYAENINIISLVGTFHKIIRPNDRLISKGLVTQHYRHNDEFRVRFNLWCENQNRDLVMKGTALCLFFQDEKHEKSQGPIPIISKSSHQEFLNREQDFLNFHKSIKETSIKKT